MRRPALRLLPICLAMACAARAQDPAPPAWEFCPDTGTLPLYRPLPAEGEAPANPPTDVSALHLDVSEQEVTVLTGEVELQRGDQWLGTEKLTYDHGKETFRTGGPARYQDRGLRLRAAGVQGDQRSDVVQLQDVEYQFNTQAGNGRADSIELRGEEGTLTGASYSTCPPARRQWEFRASRIDVDQAEGIGTARNATLRVGGVPLLWLPWVRFPIDDRRRTGLLSPTIGHDDRNGFEYEQPIYLNLAPNYDATLSPRWLSDRGLMLGAQFRYLGRRDARGELEGTWLPDDDLTGNDRGVLHWRHFDRLGRHWSLRANINHVSDDDYFTDFGDSLPNSTITLLESSLGLFGRGRGWDASLQVQRWQIANPLLPDSATPYRRLPEARLQWSRPFARWIEAGVDAEAVRFDSEFRDGGNRLDLTPWVELPFGGAAWFATPRLAWRYTAYSLDRSLVPPGGDDNPDRSLPVMSLDMGAFFEREFTFGDGNYLQTLEPRLYYLNVPYRDQDDLPLFDARPLTFSWPGLFRDNRFAGADRVGDADQVTVAVTSRVLDAGDGRELLSVGLGRIHYFEPPRVDFRRGSLPPEDGSSWVAEASLSPSSRWSLGLAHQWDPDGKRTELSAVRGQWRFGERGLVNAAYRYRADLIEQTDLSFVLPVHDQWTLLGRWNYSLRDRQSLEALAGVEWKSCCVAVRVLGRRYLREFSDEQSTGIYLEIELNGVGSFGRNTGRLLDDAILDYSR
ncbi:LPS-assembly protein LptD [Arenimonas soli]|uniref:LPS-assembly protein LptD n=1 Tax=Arenimonas soli TaxID=2269504 RepID=A0ABQ1HQM3_9GAMM|nr:LPS assembly protein LptD [Arenimonas soli]GGA86361.1 LPS-assembly protein LptD [Arenimonas soli]